VILFADHPHADAHSAQALVGGKAASLWQLTRLGLPVPPSFTVPIAPARRLADGDAALADALATALPAALAQLATTAGRQPGDATDPLLLSVRSGAAQSMPGMMDTFLNIGAPADAAPGWLRDARALFETQARAHGLPLDAPLADTVMAAIRAVAASWHSDRARAYRAHAGISDDGGTAVTVQAMVMGNRDAASATGVVFSRCPDTGAPGLRGDLLWQAQGEAVVAGHARTLPVAALAERLPHIANELATAVARLEAEYRDLVDVEFTIDSGRLWILQARPGKRSHAAATRIAADLANAGLISRAEAVARTVAARAAGPAARGVGTALASGLGAAPGLASGPAAFDADTAFALADAGTPPILIRAETSPEDVPAMSVAAGILTSLGGPMCHAALVAREWGLPAVVGCAALAFAGDGATLAGYVIAPGQIISIDGASGQVFVGIVDSIAGHDAHAALVQQWADNEAAAQRQTVDRGRISA
jgi:pyruvate,orthophosphate dikinase